MKKLTIGVFDSGVGGLTAMDVLAKALPCTDIIYFGDTGHMPYGAKTRDELIYMARKNVAFLEELGCDFILAACGSVTSVALDTVMEETETPLFGVAFPAAKRALDVSRNKKIGFIATQACVDSGFNQNMIHAICPNAVVYDNACPRFVPLIEAGISTPDSPELMDAIADYLAKIKRSGADTIILGCTHYPIITEAIGKYLGKSVRQISSSGEAAAALLAQLFESGYTEDSTHIGRRTYYTSGDAKVFEDLYKMLLSQTPDGEIIAIEPYDLP